MFSVAMGVVLLVAAALSGHPLDGLWMLGALSALGLGLRLAGRRETRRGLRGDARHERPVREPTVHQTTSHQPKVDQPKVDQPKVHQPTVHQPKVDQPMVDQRRVQVELEATALSGVVVIVAAIGGFIFEIAQGHGGAPYTWLAALGGLAYLIAIIVFGRRRDPPTSR
jgi:hypothetical protein